MWKKLSSSLFLSYNQNNNGINIYVTDFVAVWIEQYTNEHFYSCLKTSNPDLDILDENEMLEIGKGMLRCPEKAKQVEIRNSENLHVTIMCVFPFGKFRLKFTLSKGSAESFYRHVTQGLLRTIDDLKKSETKLSNLLNKKDREVHEYYKMGKLNCVRFNTPEYNEKVHMEEHNTFESTFGTTELPIAPLDITQQNGNNSSNIKKENDVKSDTILIKKAPENSQMEIPSTIKVEENTSMQESVKLEHDLETSTENGSHLNVKIENASGDNLGISPRKKQKYKLNL